MLQIALLIMVASDSSFVAGVPARRSSPRLVGASNGVTTLPAAAAQNGVHKRARSPARAAAPRLVAAAASADDGARSPLTQWVIRNRSLLLLLLLVVHKSVTDSLTRYTRVQGAYSASTVAMMAEIFKFPLIISAIASIGGGLDQVIPTFRMALAAPLGNAWIALCYTFNNLLYFPALSSLSAVAYQVLSQSKTLFTAGMMYFVVGKKLTRKQVGAAAAQFCPAGNSVARNSRTPRNSLTPRAFPLAQVGAVFLLIAGALMVQFQELGTATAVAGVTTSAVYWAAFLTLFSSFISALPNVVYEKVLKAEGANQWVNNVQVTWWIIIWVTLAGLIGPLKSALGGAGAAALAGALPPLTLSGLKASFVGAFAGFTPAVWGVVVLKALNGLIIPATFKYADNIVYSYAKPSSIVVTTVLGAVLAGQLPAPSLVAGVALVLLSIQLYSSKPKEE